MALCASQTAPSYYHPRATFLYFSQKNKLIPLPAPHSHMTKHYWYWLWKTFLGPSRLRRKFVRTFIVTGMIPLILMGSVSFYLVNLTHQLDVSSIESTIAEQTATEINRSFARMTGDLTITAAFDNFAPITFDQQETI